MKYRSASPSRAYTNISSARRGCGTRRVSAPWKCPGSRKSSVCMAATRRPCSGRQDDRLARRLRVEELVGFLRLVEPPAMREELLHVDAPVGHELGALGLALLRERPRAHQRHLPAQEVRAHVERHLAAL